MVQKPKKMRGSQLVAHVFCELREELGDEFSAEELLQAAESLINLSREEYILRSLDSDRERPDYRNDNVCHAFERRRWEVLLKELRDDSIEDDRLSTNFEANLFLNHLLKRLGNG